MRLKGEIITEKFIKDVLEKQGVKVGDHLLVHSSLSKLGYVEGGPGTIIKALCESVSLEGTLLMPSFPANGFNYNYLITQPVFDVLQTPSKMGLITEVFRKMPNVERSLHPTDSVCALGLHAKEFVKEHFGQLTPYNEFSPFAKLIHLKGKILLIGVNLDSVTNFHTTEDSILNFKYPVYHEKIMNTFLIDKERKTVSMNTKVHDPKFSVKRKCSALEPVFLEKGIMKNFKLGNADCFLIDAAKMDHWMLDNYKNGITIYTPFGNELN